MTSEAFYVHINLHTNNLRKFKCHSFLTPFYTLFILDRCHPSEMSDVECQQMSYAMNVAHGHQPSVMNLFPNDSQRFDDSFPSWIDIRRFG
jgi:hypothetical protein